MVGVGIKKEKVTGKVYHYGKNGETSDVPYKINANNKSNYAFDVSNKLLQIL